MTKGRLETFSDGVLAIVLTIMVLEMKIPHGGDLHSLKPLVPVFISYILSFIYIGIYWNNHHHMMHAVEQINGKIMWANMFLLFWLSLVPFATLWMGENNFSFWPVAMYGVILLMAGVAYFLLAKSLLSIHKKDSTLAKAIGNDKKGILSIILYAVGVALAYINPLISLAIYIAVAFIWFIPDRRIEKKIEEETEKHPE